MLAALIVLGIIGTVIALFWNAYPIANRNIKHESSKVSGFIMGWWVWVAVVAILLSWTPLIAYTGYFRAWMFVVVLFGTTGCLLPFANDKSNTAYRYVDFVHRVVDRFK